MGENAAGPAGDRLDALLPAAPLADVLAFVDTLPAVRVAELSGVWLGREIATGNPLDGLLGRFGWYGKRFEGADEVHPLLFHDGRGGVVGVNPALAPLPLVVRVAPLLRNPLAVGLFRLVLPLLRTGRPRARLRVVEYRGVASAAMLYDALPVYDAFRKVDEDTVVGLMDMRGLDRPFVFVLRRRCE